MTYRPSKPRPVPIAVSTGTDQQKRTRQQSALADLSQRAIQSKSIELLFEDAVGIVSESLHLRYSDVLEASPDRTHFTVRAGIGWGEGYVGSELPLSRESQAGYSFQTQRRVVVDDIHADTPYTPPPAFIEHEVVSSLAVPIAVGDTGFGVLGAHSTLRHPFTEEEISFVQAVANVLAGAVQRVRYEEEMRQSELYFRGLLESAPDGMAIVDRQGRMVLVNKQVEALFGYSRSELIGERIEMFVPERYRKYHSKHRDNFAEQPHTRPMGVGLDLFGVRKDGTEFPVEISLSPMETPTGTVVTAAIRDITERKKAEAQISRLNAQLEEALRRSDRLATTGRLAASIAHEINNPLESITGALYLLAEDVKGEQLDLVHNAQRELERLGDIARLTLEPHRAPRASAVIHAHELLDSASATFANKRQRHNIELICDYDERAVVTANAGELRQVLTNLIANALDVLPDGGRLTLRTKVADNQVNIMVEDTGPGIAPENIDQIFEPFFSTKGEKGLGLGLWISRNIIKTLGGNMTVSSATSGPNQGTRFTVTLPLCSADSIPASATDEEAKASPTADEPGAS